MHLHDAAAEELTEAIVRYAVDRVRMDPVPLDGPRSPAELAAACGPTITAGGLGGQRALDLFAEVLAPACISIDHPRYLSFVPCAATEAAVLFDLVVGASSVYGGSWMEGAGAVFAENAALRWIADLAGMPPTAGGVFVSGGTAGNLSALLAARSQWRRRAGGALDRVRGLVVASAGAHSSVAQAARVMDVDVVAVAADPAGRMSGSSLRAALDALTGTDLARMFAIVATAGTTNAGVIDDLAGAADAAEATGCWLHVDGAYGGAALAAPSRRERFAGIERADSFIVDPHKWLFAPFDSCALLYRDPQIAREAHTQHAEYLDVLHEPHGEVGTVGTAAEHERDWNPSDFAHHLTRRARGLPFWFSLAAHGTEAYAQAIEATLAVAHAGAELIRQSAHCELVVEPELSVVVFRRLGWERADYQAWSDHLLATGEGFVMPTAWEGETVLRICVVNPRTTVDDLRFLVDSLADAPER